MIRLKTIDHKSVMECKEEDTPSLFQDDFILCLSAAAEEMEKKVHRKINKIECIQLEIDGIRLSSSNFLNEIGDSSKWRKHNKINEVILLQRGVT